MMRVLATLSGVFVGLAALAVLWPVALVLCLVGLAMSVGYRPSVRDPRGYYSHPEAR